MTRRFLARWVGMVAWGILSFAIASTARAADEEAAKELQATAAKDAAAYNAGQVDAVLAFWTENSDFVDARGQFHEGRDLIAALFRRGFANNPGRKIQLASASRKFLTPEIALVLGDLEGAAAYLQMVADAKPEDRVTLNLLAAIVAQREAAALEG